MAQNNPFVVIEKINVRLTIKEKNDGGHADVPGSSSGLFIQFNKVFLDVRAINVTARKQSPDVEALYEFGTEDDGGFTAYVVRKSDGVFVAGTVDWQVRGV